MELLQSSLHISQIIGWVGVMSYVLAYLLLSTGTLKSDKMCYHLMNLIGAAGLVIHAIVLHDNQNLVVNAVWGLIAVFAIVCIFKRRSGREA